MPPNADEMSAGVDVALLREWIGKTELARDVLTPRLACELNATLGVGDIMPEAGAAVPYAMHWCLTPPIVSAIRIGPDGHPQRGGFLPPVPLPRRMWAGSKLTFHSALQVGDVVERKSTIADIVVKHGRTGTLCFVAVDHEISSPRGLAITERQDIVYRDLAHPASTAAPPKLEEFPEAEHKRDMQADPVLLFRYSALTFNGHRIHYDRDYAVKAEFYPGLVVHGPLQATLLLAYAAEILGRHPDYFAFRGTSPLFDFQHFTMAACQSDTGLKLWIKNEHGTGTMQAEAR